MLLLKLLSSCNAFDVLATVKTERHSEWWDKLPCWAVGSRGWNILPYTILEISLERNQRGHDNVLKISWESTEKTKYDNTTGALNNTI